METPIFRRIAAAALALAGACSCGDALMDADLVFVEGDASNEADAAITGATGEMSHVGIIEVERKDVYVIDASSLGVCRRTLEEFTRAQCGKDGSEPALHFARLAGDFPEELRSQFVENALKLVGKSYDYTFLPDNDEYYCSELVQACYVVEGEPLFKASPMNFRNSEGGFDQFWVDLFGSMDMDIPQDVPGTNPSDMFRSPQLEEINTNQK